jgi:hypothetical protein
MSRCTYCPRRAKVVLSFDDAPRGPRILPMAVCGGHRDASRAWKRPPDHIDELAP